MSEFAACLLLIAEQVDEFTLGEKPSEYAVLFGQINAITAAEGAISGTTGFAGPYLMVRSTWIKRVLHTIHIQTCVLTFNRFASFVVRNTCFTFCTVSISCSC
jgi:hypothetical protein